MANLAKEGDFAFCRLRILIEKPILLGNFHEVSFDGRLGLAMSTLMAQATTLTVYDGVKAGKQKFDATVAAADGMVKNDVLDDLPYASDSIDRGDYTITKNDGGTLY